MRVAYVATSWDCNDVGRAIGPGAATYYRCLLPAAALSEFGGHTVGVFARWGTEAGEIVPYDERGTAHHGADVIVLHSWMNRKMADVVEAARSRGQIVISDLDDHYWAAHWSNRLADVVDPTISPEWNTDHYTRALCASSHVTVSTPYLADVVRGLGQPNVTVLRNMIDLRMWHRQPVADRVRHVGWLGSTSLRSQDLEQLGTSLRRFLRAHPSVKFLHGGAQEGAPWAAKLIGVPVSSSLVRSGVPFDQYPGLWSGVDVALCPLNPIDFNRAKSALKGMEASAAGVPFIASDLDEYRWYGQGRMASTPREWGDQLEALLDREVRQELADAAYERIQLEDCSVRWREWEQLYTGLLEGGGKTLSLGTTKNDVPE